MDLLTESVKPEARFLLKAINYVKQKGFESYCVLIDSMAVVHTINDSIIDTKSCKVGDETKGELTLGMVRPKDLLFHIREAREIADAQRIGHGVDISYETSSIELLEDLKENSVIEINLTSNSFILGVEKNKHPYLIYSKYNVPMVIATDDSGVSRNNLTNEFLLLSTRYKPSYKRLKQYIYNSIQYSFLPEHQKTIIAKRIDNSFLLFEKDMAGLYERLSF